MRNFNPKTRQQNERLVIRDQPGFDAGVFDDIPGYKIKKGGVKYSQNYVLYPWGAISRGGTKQWSETTLPYLVGRTGYHLSKVNNIVTRSNGTVFTAADVGNYIVHDDGKHEKIIAFISASAVLVENSTAHADSTAGWMRGPAESKVHEGQNKWFLHIDTRLFVADWEISAWVQCPQVGPYAPSSDKSIWKEFGDYLYIFNGTRIFKLNATETAPTFFAINTSVPDNPITDIAGSSTKPYCYKYLYAYARLKGAGVTGNRQTAGVIIEQQSGPCILDVNVGRDYSMLYAAKPVGEGGTTYSVLTGAALVAPYNAVIWWYSQSNAQFRITIGDPTGSASYNFTMDFSGCTNWTVVCQKIQEQINVYFPLVTVAFSVDHFVITNPVDGGILTVTSAGDSGTNIGSAIMKCQVGVGTITTPGYTAPLKVNKLNMSTDPTNTALIMQHWNRYVVFRTLDVGVNGINPQQGLANEKELYIWVDDIPVAKAFKAKVIVSSNQITITDPVGGVFQDTDVGETVYFQDGTAVQITAYVSATVASCSHAAAVTEQSAGIGVGVGVSAVITGSMTGGVFTLTSGTKTFTTADVGKVIYTSNGDEVVILSIIDTSNVHINVYTTKSGMACVIDPTGRIFSDNVRDDYSGTAGYKQLRPRASSDLAGSLPNRFWEPFESDNNCGTINNGFMFAAKRGSKNINYCQMPAGLEFLAGYHNPDKQIATFKDAVSHFEDYEGAVAIIQNNRLDHIPTNTYTKIVIAEVGEEVAVLTSQYEIDSTIGCRDWGSIRKVGRNVSQFKTNEPGVRQLSYSSGGFALGPNLAYDRIMKRLNKMIGESASAYDPTNGWQVWDDTEIADTTVVYPELWFKGGTDSDFNKAANWVDSLGVVSTFAPNSVVKCHLDASSPNCTMSADGNCYSIDFTSYTKAFDMADKNLTVEENGLLTGGSFDPGTGTLILNNSVAGTSSFAGCTFDPLGEYTSTVRLKKTTSANITSKAFNVFTVADPSTICILTGSAIFITSFNVNGGSVDGTGTMRVMHNAMTTTPLGFVSGSDILGGLNIIIEGFNGTEVKTLPALTGSVMAVYFKLFLCSPVLTGNVNCIDFWLNENGGSVKLTSNGYNITCSGYFKADTLGGDNTVDVRSVGGRHTIITACHVDVNIKTSHGGQWQNDGTDKIIIDGLNPTQSIHALNFRGSITLPWVEILVASGQYALTTYSFNCTTLKLNAGTKLVGHDGTTIGFATLVSAATSGSHATIDCDDSTTPPGYLTFNASALQAVSYLDVYHNNSSGSMITVTSGVHGAGVGGNWTFV